MDMLSVLPAELVRCIHIDGLLDRSDLPTGISGIKLIEPVSDSSEIIVDAVWSIGIISFSFPLKIKEENPYAL